LQTLLGLLALQQLLLCVVGLDLSSCQLMLQLLQLSFLLLLLPPLLLLELLLLLLLLKLYINRRGKPCSRHRWRPWWLCLLLLLLLLCAVAEQQQLLLCSVMCSLDVCELLLVGSKLLLQLLALRLQVLRLLLGCSKEHAGHSNKRKVCAVMWVTHDSECTQHK
jgi:hypothetical protein